MARNIEEINGEILCAMRTSIETLMSEFKRVINENIDIIKSYIELHGYEYHVINTENSIII